ncbi:undecaprenyl-diphosphate phosphatase [Cocleimonas flava]|uniref:Undecaprenyl-diphosphatase n=1 Tax=Cocleimonas flava TaxID=634765 RepID=A0A4R1EW17_9GAMM|nr:MULTISPECIES: undecaprenyl-diphosphate phosphatase [Cocleimonas]MEB8432882.1 undecaprenyl-diphosphate phosphatase [Cocleimonas sp. KMM 6892]MEC4715741.1 undecaprenyl-diphosphate phosphatase [Cocleimonas sp. KMM 6895]MEC4744641.1 undecaprenyl-diphosphate phosphatase [Cocleimonas sp. KMM 6896]TCJ83308.1 undecaprenyl-diphosphatase [Cocleimonas flava]
MEIIHAVILGIIEGITEFLPISSTGHLIVGTELMGLPQTKENTAFQIIIQLSAILAVIANYKDKFHPKHFDLWVKLLIAFLPLAIIGFIFKDQIKMLFSVQVVAIMFIVGGIIFLIIEHFQKTAVAKTLDVEDISYKQAAWIGIAQVFALVPGTSRAGSTIVGALLVGLSRKASAEFSFLLALPVMAATSGYELLKNYKDFSDSNLMTLAVGFVVSFIVAYFTMKLFLRFLEKFTFVGFGIYRIIFGVILLYLIYTGVISSSAHA